MYDVFILRICGCLSYSKFVNKVKILLLDSYLFESVFTCDQHQNIDTVYIKW